MASRFRDPPPSMPPDNGSHTDPTKNVGNLVFQEGRYQDALREALKEYQDGMREASNDYLKLMVSSSTGMREAELRLQNWMRDSESKRVDQLASLRQVYETRIAEMLAVSVKSTSDLVSTQLVQIQATFNDRVSKLEQFRWESGGKSSISDPAMADAMTGMSASIAALSASTAKAMTDMSLVNSEAMAKLVANINTIGVMESGGMARRTGQGQLVQWMVMGIMMLAAIAGPIISLVRH
jgi:hypothetical protein